MEANRCRPPTGVVADLGPQLTSLRESGAKPTTAGCAVWDRFRACRLRALSVDLGDLRDLGPDSSQAVFTTGRRNPFEISHIGRMMNS